MLAACQSKTYTITGEVEGLENGDTLFITDDLQAGIPTDTLIVEDGKFNFNGIADSTYIAMVYSQKRNEINAPFFVEPGNITIELNPYPVQSRVSGTVLNNEWQKLNDEVQTLDRKSVV